MAQDREALARLLAEYARSIGLDEGVSADAGGLAALSFDDWLVVHFAPGEEPDTALLYARIGSSVPGSERLDAYRRMLEANLLGDTLGGGTLALDDRGEPVLVHRTRLRGMSGAEFGLLVEQLVDAAEVWRAGLAGTVAQPGAEAGAEPTERFWLTGPSAWRV